jgi:hypothetical protein
MKLLLTLFFVLLISAVANAQDNYDASLISKDLLPYASAVIRNKEVSIEVKDLDNTVYHIKEAITVLNKNGNDIAHIVVWHNKSNKERFITSLVN